MICHSSEEGHMESTSFVKMKLVFEDGKEPYFEDITSLFHDLELLYDFSLLLYADAYDTYRFSQYFWFRGGKSIKAEHKLRALRIVKESPLTVELLAAMLSPEAIWAFVQIIQKISSWPLERQKLKLEVEGVRLENYIRSCRGREAKIDLDDRLLEREAELTLDRLLKRLEKNPIKLREMDLTSEKDDIEHRE